MSYLQKHPNITRSRIGNFLSDNQWKDVNLQSTLYDLHVAGPPHVHLEVWSAPGQSRPTFEEATSHHFKPTKVGQAFGPSWTTHWFRCTVNIPKPFRGKPVQFMFDSNSEAMVWSATGQPIMGLTGGGGSARHVDYLLTESATEDEPERQFYVEMACNDLFGNGDYHKHPQDRPIYYRLNMADLVAPNPEAWRLFHDMDVLVEMANRLPHDSPRCWQALTAANQVLNRFEHTDKSTLEPCHQAVKEYLGHKNPQGNATHQVYAIGNCHIDTAWLWPFAETKRKSARSWATQLHLMEDFPEYRFVASQAQQFEWLKEDYPDLFQRVQKATQKGQFIPIGGTWVEMDCNLPSGESLARQFLLGQRFFQQHFGETCDIFWLPDTFGYSSQLPQIVRLSGARYFFTQKLSWNNINQFPNTTFRWVGLDGSHVLTHMAPSNTYNAQCRPGELVDSVRRHKDVAYTNESLYLFGNGDGGGGPLRSMLERLRRMEDVDGIPKVKQAHPREFYQHVEQTAKELVAWKGELYFELHRGTYTSQSNNKRNNRKAEYLLREVELLSTVAHFLKEFEYPEEELTRLWKLVCLCQFHDVIPGSAIHMVYEDSDRIYRDIFASAERLQQQATACLYGKPADYIDSGLVVLNTTGWVCSDILNVPVSWVPQELMDLGTNQVQISNSSNQDTAYVFAENVPGMCTRPVTVSNNHNEQSVSVYQDHDNYVLANQLVRVTVNQMGQITSYIDLTEDRELVPQDSLGNLFELYDDVPIFWDAWDIEIYHLEKYQTLSGSHVTILESGPLLGLLQVQVPISPNSVLKQTISLSAISPRLDFDCLVDWHENRKCLKVSFTWDIYHDTATYETQFGVIERPTYRNTTWDMAKFEVVGHKFADLSEFGYGVALLNDCKYGYATLENTMSLSLIRAPKSPDEHCDMGQHAFRYAVYPHRGTFSESNVVQEAYQFNVPLRAIPMHSSKVDDGPLFAVSGARNVVLDTVKVAEDDKDSFVVRMYESYGGHAKAMLTCKLPATKVQKVNILEQPMDGEDEISWLQHSRTVQTKFKPYEVVSLKFSI